jgi:ATP-binding cassette, subfamily B, bacterial CvaB/MchF/RaxB
MIPRSFFSAQRRVPIILQAEAAECGIACIAMVASYFGHAIDLPTIRGRFSVSLKGASLKTLISVAQALGLHARPLRLELHELADLTLPCVLHWDLNHFVVLKRVTAKRIVIVDPGLGERSLTLGQVGAHFTGVALELMPGQDFRPSVESRQVSLSSLMGRVVGLRSGLAQLLLLGVALQICSLIAPFYLQWIVDEALVASDRDLVSVLGFGFLLLVTIQALTTVSRAWIGTVLATQLSFQWLSNVFGHLLRLPLSFFEKRHVGDIVSRFGSVQTIQRSVTTQLVEGVIDGLLVLATFVLMLLYSPTLSAIAVLAVIAYAALRAFVFRPLREANAEQIAHAARQQSHFLESARGIQGIRLFGRGPERQAGWRNRLVEQINAEVRIARLTISYQSANFLIFGVERVIVIWLGALSVIDGLLTTGMLLAFLAYKEQFSQRLASLIDRLFELRMLRLHAERLADIVLAEPETLNHVPEIDLGSIEPLIEFRQVSFRYADGEPWVLRDLNLRISPGQCIAITGPSGSGKTTLVKLLLGLLEPTDGSIYVAGVPLERLGLENFRRIVGAVMQDDQLFSGTIADNIAFFDSVPDKELIDTCARMAAIDREIRAMPMGLSTLIGDSGMGLSGGQKQRLLLARALYRNPRVLMLDEATSHLDVYNERVVNQAIAHLELTRVIVAHRPETIAMAHRVVVLEAGQILRDFEQSVQGVGASDDLRHR